VFTVDSELVGLSKLDGVETSETRETVEETLCITGGTGNSNLTEEPRDIDEPRNGDVRGDTRERGLQDVRSTDPGEDIDELLRQQLIELPYLQQAQL